VGRLLLEAAEECAWLVKPSKKLAQVFGVKVAHPFLDVFSSLYFAFSSATVPSPTRHPLCNLLYHEQPGIRLTSRLSVFVQDESGRYFEQGRGRMGGPMRAPLRPCHIVARVLY